MQGRLVDIDRLRAYNETVKAVGNMNVNARGDVLGLGGRIVKTKDQVMKAYYQTPKGQADDASVKNTKTQPIPQKRVTQTNVIDTTVQNRPQPKTEQVKTQKTDIFKPKSGIDAALDGIE